MYHPNTNDTHARRPSGRIGAAVGSGTAPACARSSAASGPQKEEARRWRSPGHRREASGGLRRDVPTPGTASAAIASSLMVRWVQLDADIALGRSWYLILSFSSERGGWEGSDQLYSAVSYRF